MKKGSNSKKVSIAVIALFTAVFVLSTSNVIADVNDSLSNKITELRRLYSINKNIPAEFEKDILVSLSHYPELSNIHIEFCYAPIYTSMKAVPSFWFFLHKKENRTYRIVMNSRTCQGTNLMQRIPSTAFTGVIGHELGHIKDYSSLSNFGLIKFMVKYITTKGRIAAENRADQFAIDHELGNELVEFTSLIYQDNCMNPSYIKYKKKYYCSPEMLSNFVAQRKKTATF